MTGFDGDLVITRVRNEHTGEYELRIDQADKLIRIAPELLEEVRSSRHPDAIITAGELRITGVNRSVTYRIGELAHDGFHPWYQAERVDEHCPSPM